MRQEHPQSESQPGFPFLNFFEEKFFRMILKRAYPAKITITAIRKYCKIIDVSISYFKS